MSLICKGKRFWGYDLQRVVGCKLLIYKDLHKNILVTLENKTKRPEGGVVVIVPHPTAHANPVQTPSLHCFFITLQPFFLINQ